MLTGVRLPIFTLCLSILAHHAWAVEPPAQKIEASLNRGESDVLNLLTKQGYYFLVDNQVTHSPSHAGPGCPPGIISMWTWPSGRPRFGAVGGIAAECQLWRGDTRLPTRLDEEASRWQPHLVHTEHAFPGGRIEQDLFIANDTVVSLLKVRGPPDLQIRIAGEPAGMAKVEEPATVDSMLVLKNRGSLPGIWQVLSAPGTLAFDDSRYEFRVTGSKEFVIAATLGADRQRAIARVKQARADPAKQLQHAKQRWTNFFAEQVPQFFCSDASLTELYYWIAYVLEADAYRDLEDPHWPYAYVVPSKWEWRGIWPEDLSHAMTGLRWFNDPALATDCLRTVMHRYVPDRTQPLVTRMLSDFDPQQARRDAKIHAYGFTTMATWALFLKTGDIDFMREIFPSMCKMNRFEDAIRDDDNDGLTSMSNSFQLGGDRSPRFDFEENYTDAEHRWFKQEIEHIDGNTYYLRQSQILARIAQILASPQIAREMSARAARTKAAIGQKLWDEESGFFYDALARSDKRSGVKSSVGFFALMTDAVSPDRARRLIDHLLDPAQFWPAYPVPWLAGNEPAVIAQGGWSNNTALDIRQNWLVVEGLVRQGYVAEARELIGRTLKLLRLQGPHRVETGYYYDPQTGKPPANRLNTIFSTAVGGVFDFLLRRVAGVDPVEGPRLRLRPLALNPEFASLTVSGLRYKGHELTITWNGEGNDKSNSRKFYRAYVDGRLIFESPDPQQIDLVYDLEERRKIEVIATPQKPSP